MRVDGGLPHDFRIVSSAPTRAQPFRVIKRLHALQGGPASNAATSQLPVSVGLAEGALAGLLRALNPEPDEA